MLARIGCFKNYGFQSFQTESSNSLLLPTKSMVARGNQW